MAIARGVGPFFNNTAPGTSIAVSCTGLTAGRMLVMIVEWQNVGAVANISQVQVQGESDGVAIAGSKTTYPSSPANYKQICYHPNLTGGGSKTVTFTLSNSAYATASVMEYSGQDPASQPDASGSFSADNIQPSMNLATTVNNALIVAGCTSQSSIPTVGSGYSLIGTRPDNGYHDEDEDNVDAGTAGNKTVNFVLSDPTAGEYMAVASFKPAGGVGTTPKTFTGTDSLAGGELL